MKTQKEIFAWLRSNCGRTLGGLTDTDTAALVTSVNLTNLIAYPQAPLDLFAAYRAIINAMQPHNRWMAYHAIAMELDWSYRRMVWDHARLDPADIPAFKCAYEPGGSARS